MSDLSKMVFSQYLFAIVLMIIGFVNRKSNPLTHKTNIIFGSFMLMQPAIDRAIEHLFDDIYVIVWLLTYFLIYSLFIWFFKGIKWQVAVGFIIWIIGLINLELSGGI